MSTTAVTPIEIKLGDGSVIKGANLEEALQNATKRVEDNVSAYKTEKQRADEQAAEAARWKAEAERLKNPPKPKVEGQFDNDRYFKLLNEDPVAATDYYFEYRFGRSPDEFNN